MSTAIKGPQDPECNYTILSLYKGGVRSKSAIGFAGVLRDKLTQNEDGVNGITRVWRLSYIL